MMKRKFRLVAGTAAAAMAFAVLPATPALGETYITSDCTVTYPSGTVLPTGFVPLEFTITGEGPDGAVAPGSVFTLSDVNVLTFRSSQHLWTDNATGRITLLGQEIDFVGVSFWNDPVVGEFYWFPMNLELVAPEEFGTYPIVPEELTITASNGAFTTCTGLGDAAFAEVVVDDVPPPPPPPPPPNGNGNGGNGNGNGGTGNGQNGNGGTGNGNGGSGNGGVDPGAGTGPGGEEEPGAETAGLVRATPSFTG